MESGRASRAVSVLRIRVAAPAQPWKTSVPSEPCTPVRGHLADDTDDTSHPPSNPPPAPRVACGTRERGGCRATGPSMPLKNSVRYMPGSLGPISQRGHPRPSPLAGSPVKVADQEITVGCRDGDQDPRVGFSLECVQSVEVTGKLTSETKTIISTHSSLLFHQK